MENNQTIQTSVTYEFPLTDFSNVWYVYWILCVSVCVYMLSLKKNIASLQYSVAKNLTASVYMVSIP